MGLNYDGYQRAGANHPYEENTLIWFPKLYLNKEWANDFDEEKGIILEKNIESDEKREAHVNSCLNDRRQRRIVFARVKGMLGDVQYRFRGIFVLDKMAYFPNSLLKQLYPHVQGVHSHFLSYESTRSDD